MSRALAILVVVTWAAGCASGPPPRLEVTSEVVAGDFFHWKNDDLRLGADLWSDSRFRGALAELAIWDRDYATPGERALVAEIAGGAEKTGMPSPSTSAVIPRVAV